MESLAYYITDSLSNLDGATPKYVPISTPVWTNCTLANKMHWNVLDANNSPLLTGFSAPSATSSISQNGSAAGTVTNITINPDGTIVATIGAGQSLTIGQLALVNFNNPEGLVKIGSNRYGEGPAAGTRNLGVAGTGG